MRAQEPEQEATVFRVTVNLQFAVVYDSMRVPGRYAHLSECGIVLLWSRKRAGKG